MKPCASAGKRANQHYSEAGSDVGTKATKDGASWVLSGEKVFVPDAGVADRLVVTARSRGGRRDREGVELFLVDPKAKGVTLKPVPQMDNLKRFLVQLDNVRVTEADRLSGSSAVDSAFE